jgi:type I restriction enzyme, R subunit
MKSNFEFLAKVEPQLMRLGALAERYFPEDPNTSLMKLRQFGELLAQNIAAQVGAYNDPMVSQYDLLNNLRDKKVLPYEVYKLFGDLRRSGNKAVHDLEGSHAQTLAHMKISWQLGVWFYRGFENKNFKPSSPFIPPRAPKDETVELKAELERLQAELDSHRTEAEIFKQKATEAERAIQETAEEKKFWERLAQEEEAAKKSLAEKLESVQQEHSNITAPEINEKIKNAEEAAEHISLDEADTRVLIDAQLRDAGWEANTETIRYSHGTRPQKGKNIAIAEWPTQNGPADYVLFVGLSPIAVIEAKRRNKDVSATIDQAKRYSRGFSFTEEMKPHDKIWNEYKIPFVFSTNGRPFLRQLETKSGIWFCDVRNEKNLRRPLESWYTPEGLQQLLRQDIEEANRKLEYEGFNYGFQLRSYQKKAILAVEDAIKQDKRTSLLAMATGTGKTKTCIALVYRLLKAGRFRRVLFLVDRNALSQQAADSFKDTRMENLQTFADIFGLADASDALTETEIKVQITTVQAMVKRLMYTDDDSKKPKVDQFDCIVVDECHRGYLLDREMSEAEITFRDQGDYVSKYRRVLDYFDAVKIGLTATPALHTSEIFGDPVYQYSYREAVIDGFLIDHEPPIRITTALSEGGIKWKKGEEVELYDRRTGQLDLLHAPDEIEMDISDFNKKVVTEPFNKEVCKELARHIDPSLEEKTLIFCATDEHADLVVKLMKEAFKEQYGEIEDDAVAKITGASDKPLQLIRSYKNERRPNVAVTVDLLTTGIDVPTITNLVFLRRVKSRILYEQMIGRATRLCDEINKETFRIYDAVDVYSALEDFTNMKPVVVNPKIDFKTLVQELQSIKDPEAHAQIKDQFIAKLQRKKHVMGERALAKFEVMAGGSPDDFIARLKKFSVAGAATCFTNCPDLGELLDQINPDLRQPVLISHHEDQFRSIERGYGKDNSRPEDYLDGFKDYIRKNINEIPALKIVAQRPRELTRKQLKELKLKLDMDGYTESAIKTAWCETTNQNIAASIIGFIRQYAVGDALIPYDQRVDKAMNEIMSAQAWTAPQRKWLERIGQQLKIEQIVDREALDTGAFKAEGGFNRINKVFHGKLQTILEDISEAIWKKSA